MTERTYTNPVGGVTRIGDPFVLLHKGEYYLYATSAGDGFRYWKSPDLVNWTPGGYAYKRQEDSWGKRTYWAPEVVYYKGMFYMAFSCQGTESGKFSARICIAISDRPDGPFRDLHMPHFDYGYSCIDAHIFVDDDEIPYLYYAKVGPLDEKWKKTYQSLLGGMIFGTQLSADMSHPVDEPTLCLSVSQEWEIPPDARSHCNEGAFVVKHNGTYYMTYSANHYADPNYGIGYARSTHPLGPWTKSADNPIARVDLSIGVSGPGHNSITTSPDGKELFMVYHSHTDPAKPSGNRALNIDRLVFDEEGNMRLIGPTRTPQPMPSGI